MDKATTAGSEPGPPLGLAPNDGLGGTGPKRASTCGLTECRGKPMCVRCERIADMDALCSLLPVGAHWGDPLTPELLRELLAAPKFAAKPIDWEQDSPDLWSEKNPVHWGFYITLDNEVDPPNFCAYWGENDGEQYATLDEAKAWCQKTADDFIAAAVRVTPNG